ncbi:MAG: asparagine synthase (glutamine-hydrolyzing) [Ignavibacteria bacterium]|nr:asparagine synthase (glutamine-hydrolyzing) [Ignavibacteria bacterium]
MCGICGVISFNHSDVSESVLIQMRDEMKHRGPDAEGLFINKSKKVGFGFRRLAIIDLSPAANQPMCNQDQSIWIVFNGEIYNHLEVRKELEKLGYKYKTKSDTETIIYAYEHYGIDFIHKLNGMFAIAIWDEKKKLFIAYRDRIGKKPFYYTFQNGQFIFASEIKSIFRHPLIRKDLNLNALSNYLTFLIPPAPETMFEGIKKLPAGHRLILTENGELKIEEYYDVLNSNNEIIESDEATIKENIVRLLRQSIKDRMISDVPFGVFLSGGIDSSTNVALMAELMDRPVDTFSVGYKDFKEYNEFNYARKVAEIFKTNHHEILIDAKDALNFFPDLVYHQDEPIADPVCIPLYFVSKLARENGTIVVQVGEGSDEEFAGYPWMLRELRLTKINEHFLKYFPTPLKNIFYSIAHHLWNEEGKLLELDYIRRIKDNQSIYWGGAINFTNEHKKRLLFKELNNTYDVLDKIYKNYGSKSKINDLLRKMIYLEFKNRLPELLLMRVDKMAMATSVEARVPFLDYRLVEYSFKIDSKIKIKNYITKYILKKSVEGIIPHEIIYRKKQGFAAPMNFWLRNELSDFTRNYLLNSNIHKLNLFNKDFIKFLLDSPLSNRYDFVQNTWNLLNLFMWYDYWFEGRLIG